jgi:hypothetical protein
MPAYRCAPPTPRLRADHRLARGLRAAWLRSGAGYRDLTGRGNHATTPVGTPTDAGSPWGPGWSFNGNSAWSVPNLVLPTTAITILFLARSGASGAQDSIFGTVAGEPDRIQCHFPFTGTVYWDAGNQFGARLTWTPPAGWFSNWHAMALRAGTGMMDIWSDGVRVASSTGSCNYVGGPGFDLGRFFKGGQITWSSSDLFALFLHDRVLAENDLMTWFADPFAAVRARGAPAQAFGPVPPPSPWGFGSGGFRSPLFHSRLISGRRIA